MKVKKAPKRLVYKENEVFKRGRNGKMALQGKQVCVFRKQHL